MEDEFSEDVDWVSDLVAPIAIGLIVGVLAKPLFEVLRRGCVDTMSRRGVDVDMMSRRGWVIDTVSRNSVGE